jgi:hypothetical protein
MDVEAVFFDSFVQHLAHKGGDAYDTMGKIIKGGEIQSYCGFFAKLTYCPILKTKL